MEQREHICRRCSFLTTEQGLSATLINGHREQCKLQELEQSSQECSLSKKLHDLVINKTGSDAWPQNGNISIEAKLYVSQDSQVASALSHMQALVLTVRVIDPENEQSEYDSYAELYFNVAVSRGEREVFP